MKRIFCITAFLHIFFVFSAMSQEKKIDLSELPNKAKIFIDKYYPKEQVSYVKEEVKSWFDGKEYKVKLSSGKEIEFDGEGEWKEVDAERQAVPLALVPQKIIAHVKKSFPKNTINKVKKGTKKYIVEISNGLELEFNRAGDFLRIDD